MEVHEFVAWRCHRPSSELAALEDTDIDKYTTVLEECLRSSKRSRLLLRIALANCYLKQGRWGDAETIVPSSFEFQRFPDVQEELLKLWNTLQGQQGDGVPHIKLKKKLALFTLPKEDNDDEKKESGMEEQKKGSPDELLGSKSTDSVDAAPALPAKQLSVRCTLKELDELDARAFGDAHPELSELEVYSVMLNQAILQKRVPLVLELLAELGSTKAHSLAVLTCVDLMGYSPITRCLQAGNMEIFEDVKRFIARQEDKTKTSHVLTDDMGSIMSLMEFPVNPRLTPKKCFKLLASLYADLKPVIKFMTLLGVSVG